MERDFKGVWIPKTIWLDKRLNALDKVILTEIDSLDQGENGCWASNQYIAEFCQCSASKVSTSVSKLIKFGYLYVKSFDGRTRILKSRLSNFERQTTEKSEADSEDLKESNTSTHTFNNTKKKDIADGVEVVDREQVKVSEVTKKAIDRLNELTGSNYRANIDTTKALIKRLLKNGYSEADILTVVEKMCYVWGNEPKKGEKDMRMYLRPSTLFGNKFENYLGMIVPEKKITTADIAKETDFSEFIDFMRG